MQKGSLKPKYRISKYDRVHLLRGIQEAVRIHIAAGAEKVSVLHNSNPVLEVGKGDTEKFIDSIPKLNWADNRYFLASAHQMGTCRMGGSAKRHPVRPDGEMREVRSLYVADASVFSKCERCKSYAICSGSSLLYCTRIKVKLRNFVYDILKRMTKYFLIIKHTIDDGTRCN